jgi:hypothetical protein
MALTISGAARLTPHGSAAVAVAGAKTGGGGANGAAVALGAEAIVGSGVLDTVESLEPHPATASAAAISTAHFTERDGTANATGGQTGARQGNAVPTTRLPSR